MWGQVVTSDDGISQNGIIPTRVGTSDMGVISCRPSRDHPHACGDKSSRRYVCLCELGSSPRVWGQALHFCAYQNHFRIIPTRVGTSIEKCISYFSSQDHPHACGDKIKTGWGEGETRGSSPRVWGQASSPPTFSNSFRIIPTRVGTRNEKRIN